MYPQPHNFRHARGVMTADVISDAAAFERLAAEWDRVLDESGRSTPFLKYAWVDCWRRYAHDGGTLNIIAVRERGRLAAVMPLMRVRRPFSLVDRLEFMGRGPAGADYLDVFRFAGTTTFACYSMSLPQTSIWYKRSWSTTLKVMFDGLIYSALTAGMFGWLWPR